MRVLFISDVYFPRVNGVSTSIRTFREDLAACGVETVLVAPRYDSKGGPDGVDADEPGLLRVDSGKVPRDPEDRRMRWGALARTLDSLPRDEFDVVHIHTPFIAHYAGSRFARRANIPCVATYHTFFEEYVHHYVPVMPRGIGRFIARAFTRSQCDDVQALIAPSDPMRDILVEYGVSTPIHVLPTGLPADRFVAGDGQRFRAQVGLSADRPLMTYIGRVAHEKNIDFLVHVFARVREAVPKAMLVIAGEGPARESLRHLVGSLKLEKHVYFAGYLDRNTALLDCYAAADVFAFASRTETQGLVLLEAMAQGAPVVSTAELGTRSILKPGCGAVVVEERRDEFAAAVIRVLQARGLQQELGERGRAYARTWSSTSMARRLADLYGAVRLSPGAARVTA
ncbi:MAG TPA: glycosyltransferase [Steroidobacteraceae bacterium]|nr:glycosyltransferase [Steroidobacteraceae bacterium]